VTAPRAIAPSPISARAVARPRRESLPLLFLGGHAILAVALAPGGSAPLATVHAILAFLVALHLTLTAPRRWAVAGAAYIVACEVAWRMTGAQVPWEVGKYASTLLLSIALLRLRPRARWRALPMLYMVAQLPSIGVLLARPSLTIARIRDMVSFNLSGPLSLAVAAWYLSHIEIDEEQARRVMFAIIGPILTTGGITLLRTLTATDLQFVAESNFATSGGFGPNQVSSILGLGAFLAVLLTLRSRAPLRLAWLVPGIALFLALQAALTLSRGGLYAAGLATVAAALCMLRDHRVQRRALGVGVPALLLATALIVPRIDAFTGGALSERFADRESSGRADILAEDVRIWREHPVLGVGPGAAADERRTESTVAHTEYSRLLAEHGALGVAALVVLGLMSVDVVRRGLRSPDGAIAAGLLVWSLASMAHAGMRLAAFGLVFGLAQARFTSRRGADAGRAGR